MIASERTQNIIVVSVIMITIVSSGLLVNNAVYYGGSYSLAGSLNVTLVEIKVSNIDHIIETIDPVLNLTFNIATSSLSEGNVRITFMGVAIILNNDTLSYSTFSYNPPNRDLYVTPEFNNDYSMADDVIDSDKQTLLEADISGIWNWEIEFRYSFIVFDESGTRIMRYSYFFPTTTTIV